MAFAKKVINRKKFYHTFTSYNYGEMEKTGEVMKMFGIEEYTIDNDNHTIDGKKFNSGRYSLWILKKDMNNKGAVKIFMKSLTEADKIAYH